MVIIESFKMKFFRENGWGRLHLSSIGALFSNVLFIFAGCGLSCVARFLHFTFSLLNVLWIYLQMVLSVFILGLFPFVLRFDKSNKRKVVRLLCQMLISYHDFLLLVHQKACLLNYFFSSHRKTHVWQKFGIASPISTLLRSCAFHIQWYIFFLPGYFFFFWMLFRNVKVKMFVWIMLNNCCLLLIRVLFPLTGFLYNIFGVL